MLGFAEQLEWLGVLADREFEPFGGRKTVEAVFLRAARASCDFYMENTPTDGIPYWDTGAPGLVNLGNYLERPAEIENDWEPVDSSAAVIAAQGLIRLGRCLGFEGEGRKYWLAGLTVAKRAFSEDYISGDPSHQGLLLHSVYHRPNGWDYIPEGSRIPRGESSMWGDYHARELALYIQRLASGGGLEFFGGLRN
jgi:unsaturated chondroitin disaccharide hydrolase